MKRRESGSRVGRVTVRVYAGLLGLYPRSFRRRFGDDMRAFVSERVASNEHRGIGLVWLWALLAADVARTAPRAWLESLADRAHGQERNVLDVTEHWRRWPEEEIMDVLLRDVRYAARTLIRQRAYALTAVLTLALGVGATTAIFSAVNAVLLRPLPYPHADRIVGVWGASTAAPNDPNLAPYADIMDWRTRTHVFDRLGVMRSQSVNLTGTGAPDRLVGAFVTAELFDVLGAQARIGRLFTTAESTPHTGAAVAVLSHAAWVSRFGGDPSIIGRTLTLDGRPHVVVGVLDAGFDGPMGATDVWLPITSHPNPTMFDRGAANAWAFARLRPGVSVADAQRAASVVAARLAEEYPKTNRGTGAYIVSLRDQLVGSMRASLLTVFAAVGLLLLIACANVANLQLANVLARREEIALRTALGAARGRIARQLLTESVLLALVGGALGALVARWAIAALVALVPGGLPAFGTVGVDSRALLFALAASLASALAIGLVPAMRLSRTDVRDALGARGTQGRASRGVRGGGAVTCAQLALCTALLVTAGLVTRSLMQLGGVDPGFAPEGILTAEMRLPPAKYPGDTARALFFERLLSELRAVPGVEASALVGAIPLSGNWGSTGYEIEGRPLAPDAAPLSAEANAATDGFFATMHIPMLAGRDFEAVDRLGSPRVAIINQTLAHRAWPEVNAVGKRLRLSGDTVWTTVVGVVGDITQRTLGDPPTPQIYTPMLQTPGSFTSIVVRTSGNPASATASLRHAIWAIDRDQPVWSISPLQSIRDDATQRQRFTSVLTAGFAVLSLLLGAIGVYGVTSYAVTQRSREIGLRLALGAPRAGVVALFVGRTARLAATAAILGVAVAALVSGALRAQLFGVSPRDPLTFLLAPTILVAVALIASYLPARRASRFDPMITLREE